MTCVADLIHAGYGPNPARSLTWRKFWYFWADCQIRAARTQRQAQAWQLYVAILAQGGKADQVLAQVEAKNAAAEAQQIAALIETLPRSVRPLLRPLADAGAAPSSGLEAIIESYPPGSVQRAFWEGARQTPDDPQA